MPYRPSASPQFRACRLQPRNPTADAELFHVGDGVYVHDVEDPL